MDSTRKVAYWIERKVADDHYQYICSNCNDYHAFRCIHSIAKEFNDNYRFCRKCGSYMIREVAND